MGSDEYIGKVDRFISYAHVAGAMMLLVLPFLETAEAGQDASEADPSDTDTSPDSREEESVESEE